MHAEYHVRFGQLQSGGDAAFVGTIYEVIERTHKHLVRPFRSTWNAKCQALKHASGSLVDLWRYGKDAFIPRMGFDLSYGSSMAQQHLLSNSYIHHELLLPTSSLQEYLSHP